MASSAALAIAFSVTVLFMLALRPVAFSIGLVDKPGGRKAHIGEVPIIGGLAMFSGILIGMLMLPQLDVSYFYLNLAGFLLVVVGLLDDRYGLSASIRLVAQLIAVLIMVYGGQQLMADLGNPLGLGPLGLGPLKLLVTAVITITVVNAYNLIDGVDGLAGGMALVALIALGVVAGESDTLHLVWVAAAAICGFLLFNFPTIANRRVRAFMGDSGSTFLGMIVVWLTISISQGESRLMSPTIGLWFAAIPIFDLLTCIVRRSLRGKSPVAPGRDHFHHMLKRGGIGVRKVLFSLTGLQAIYCVIGLAGHYAGVSEPLMFLAWSVLGLTQHLVIKRFAVWRRYAKWCQPARKSFV